MSQIKLYDREPIALMLDEFGFAVEKFPDWESSCIGSHGHDILEMNYILRGRAVQTVAGVEVAVEAGSLSVVNYGMEHEFSTEPQSTIDIINIYIDIQKVRLPQFDRQLRELLRGIIPLHKISANNLNKVVSLRVSDSEKFQWLLEQMIEESKERKTGYKVALEQYFTQFLIMLCRFSQENGLSRTAEAASRDMAMIDKLLDYIENNCHKHLTLERLAEYCGIDKHSLCRKFRRVTGKTVFEYIKSRRLEAAMYELRSTDKKIIDIALDCGFANISNFNRCFKEAIKATPTGYRSEWLDN
ncbi:MAG: AraC family transcriptional regulator [Sedimentisphaeraceae bacterium JB056]